MALGRQIFIEGEISSEAYVSFDKKLSGLERQSVVKRIYVSIISDGGDAYAALAFHDRIRKSPCNIIITATGLVASAAVLILAAGDKRYMTKSAWVMTHEDTTTVKKSMRVSQAEKELRHARRLEDQWSELLAELTTSNFVTWEHLHLNETYLSPKECLDLGLIERIV